MFTLMDGNARHAAHPDTFHIPSNAELVALKPGQYVKLGFQEGESTERAWVEVKTINGRHLTGVVNNDLVVMETVKDGDEISFAFHHILGIYHRSAIEIIENAKATHLRWIKRLQEHPDGGELEKPITTAGDIAHHEQYIADYDIVLEALRGEVDEERLHLHRQD